MDQRVQFRPQSGELEVGFEPLDVVAKRRRVESRELAIGSGVEVAARACEQEGRSVSEARARELGASVAAALDRGQDLTGHDERPSQRPDLVGVRGRRQVPRLQFVGRDDAVRIDVERGREPLAFEIADVGTASGEPDGSQHGRRPAVLEGRQLTRVVEHRSRDLGYGFHLEPVGGAVDRQFGVSFEVALTHIRPIGRTDIINF